MIAGRKSLPLGAAEFGFRSAMAMVSTFTSSRLLGALLQLKATAMEGGLVSRKNLKDLAGFAFDPRGLAANAREGNASASCVDGKTLELQAGACRTSFSAGASWTMREVIKQTLTLP